MPACVNPPDRCSGESRSAWNLASPKSSSLTTPLAAEHQVGRLDVAVDELVLMGMLEPQRGLADHLAGRAHAQRLSGLPLGLDQALEVDAVHVFHRQEMDAVGLAGVVGTHDVRMLQRADRLHLPLEPGYRLGVRQDTARAALSMATVWFKLTCRAL